VFSALLLIGCASAQAQAPVWTKPDAPQAQPAEPSSAQQPQIAPGQQSVAPAAPATPPPPAAVDQAAAPSPEPAQQAAPAENVPGHPIYYKPIAGKKNKMEYVGPKEVVELPPTPMLDEEGRQRLDPEGKPMFNPPVKQQRDKKGNPIFDQQGKPVMQASGDLGYDEKGKKIHGKKEKPPKMVSVAVERGTLTVDGMTGKAGLNYDIKNLKFIYMYAPWIGVTIVSNSPFPGATLQKGAFNDKTLTVTVEDHTLQLYSDKRFFKKAEPAYVAVDRSFKLPSQFPVIGYGETLRPPYAWPGSRENAALKGPMPPPPLPPSIRPVLLLQPCPAGQMRLAGKAPLPGEVAPVQPCVPIQQGLQAENAAKAAASAKASAAPAATASANPPSMTAASPQPPQ
jgi:hypothetical protein